MLFVNKKYESLDKLLNERLSQNEIDEFSDWLANSDEADELENGKLDEYKNKLQGASLANKYYSDLFDGHGIDKDTAEKFITICAKYVAKTKDVKIDDILEKCGKFKFSALKKYGNIFDEFKIDHGLGASLAELKNTSAKGKKKRSQEGEFEVLLRFFLDGGGSVPDSRGDVKCSEGVIEVKASKDARPGGSYKDSSMIFSKIDEAINKNITNRSTAKYNGAEPLKAYFDNHIEDLENLEAATIAEAVVEGVCDLYGISSDEDKNTLKTSAKEYFTAVNYNLLKNLIGLTELAAYTLLSAFDYIIFFKDTGGKYKYYDKEELFKFGSLASELHITAIGAGKNDGDAVAKIGLKQL